MISAPEVVSQYDQFDIVIDARSPSEFAEDHLPGALNWPVLDDEERRLVGTLFKQVSALEARKVGATLVARNIANHIERWVQDKPRDWKPLVYCWRGGQRSGSLAWFLGQIGFRTAQLSGGYKAFRAIVREDLATLPQRYRYNVLCGRTGSGKTRLLQTLSDQGAQTLDLEGLARHRGSVLGGLPGQPQPSQKHFDTLVWQALRNFDTARPVFVESESHKIGALRVPEALLHYMHEHGHCLRIEMSEPARVQLLLEEYGFFAEDIERFCRLLNNLVELHGHEVVQGWQAKAREGAWAALFAELMQQHYDPLYQRSLQRNFKQLAESTLIPLRDGGAEALAKVAAALLA